MQTSNTPSVSRAILPVLLWFWAALCSADSITYIYDAAGNRTARVIVLSAPPPQQAKAVQEEPLPPPVVETSLKNLITISPNPTRGRLAVEVQDWQDTQRGSLTVLDLQGRVILGGQRLEAFTELDLSSYPPATYLLIISLDGQTATWKIMKQ